MEIMTVKELSQLLRIGINSTYRLVHNGTIRSVRVGRVYRIPRNAVEEYLSQRANSCA